MNFGTHHGFTSSPRTSDEAESHRGTPDTKLTAFSPEEVCSPEKSAGGDAVGQGGPPAFTIKPNYTKCSPTGHFKAYGCQDPFVTVHGPVTGSKLSHEAPKLSPTASSFTPLGAFGNDPTISGTGTLGYTLSASSGVGFLNATSLPDATSGGKHLKDYLQSVASELTTMAPIGPRSASGPTTPVKSDQNQVDGVSGVDVNATRSLMVSNISRKTSGKELADFFDGHIFPSLKGLVLIDLASSGIIYVGFTDIRDSQKAFHKAKKLRTEWATHYLPSNQFDMKRNPGSPSFASAYEGQVTVRAHYGGQNYQFNTGNIRQLVQELLDNYGDIKVFRELDAAEPPLVEFHADFYDTAAAEVAVVSLDGFKIGGYTLAIAHYEPDVMRLSPRHIPSQGALPLQRHSSGLGGAFAHMTLGTRPGSYESIPHDLLGIPVYARPSPTGRSIIPREESLGYWASPQVDFTGHSYPRRDSKPVLPVMYSPHHREGAMVPLRAWDVFGPGAIGQERGQTYQPQLRNGAYSPQRRGPARFGGRHTHDFASGHHNVVDVERIRRGLDVRTTIMLRNIPNKIDQAMLKEIVDETSIGKYDFMYLRIDFANNCNVGYAFINFEDPWFIIDFVNARAGLRWNRFNSDKVAEVSYATIQGKDCLVQKFRNSSVMLEHPSFRPKIFHTGTGALSGKEDTFPGPDNPSKMRRSVENAEHVGLFAPRAGQHFRDEQRRRRSQYDRGTRLAELEDAYEYGTQGYHAEAFYRPVIVGNRQQSGTPHGYAAVF